MINGKKNKEGKDPCVIFLTSSSFPKISVASSCFCETTQTYTSFSNLIVTTWLFQDPFTCYLPSLSGTVFLIGGDCCCVALHRKKTGSKLIQCKILLGSLLPNQPGHTPPVNQLMRKNVSMLMLHYQRPCVTLYRVKEFSIYIYRYRYICLIVL